MRRMGRLPVRVSRDGDLLLCGVCEDMEYYILGHLTRNVLAHRFPLVPPPAASGLLPPVGCLDILITCISC
jgi:hypothetical protein